MFDSRHVTRVARLVAHAEIGSPSCFVLFAVKLTLLLLLSGSLMSKSSHGENVKALVTTVTVTVTVTASTNVKQYQLKDFKTLVEYEKCDCELRMSRCSDS